MGECMPMENHCNTLDLIQTLHCVPKLVLYVLLYTLIVAVCLHVQ